jgi:hypothetical protein
VGEGGSSTGCGGEDRSCSSCRREQSQHFVGESGNGKVGEKRRKRQRTPLAEKRHDTGTEGERADGEPEARPGAGVVEFLKRREVSVSEDKRKRERWNER